MTRTRVDRVFLSIVAFLVIGGFFIFSSASLGLLARDGAQFSSVAFNQLVLGIGLGSVALIVLSNVPYRIYRPYALYLFIAALIATSLVFVPGIGMEFGGAKRWLSIFGFSIQPSEFLKIASIIYIAAWLSKVRGQLGNIRTGLVPFVGTIGVIGLVLLAQPDTDTFVVIAAAAAGMYLCAGARFRDIAILGGMLVAGILVLALMRPYLMDRFLTFLDPSSDPQGSGYQIQQSLIAVGSGELFGRGFGQSIQKFNYLPEPIGDSIFSVAAEEFGFIGGLVVIGAFTFFAFRGFRIAARAPDYFGGLITVGIVILITTQSFINIGSMLGVLPLTGIPLVFISHGGTALLFALASIGIVLNISKHPHGNVRARESTNTND
jgi:cell division protein FtsW